MNGGVTWRALAIALALTPVNAYWLVQSEVIWWSGFPTTISLFSNVTFILFVLATLNLWLQNHVPSRALTPAELVTVYVFLSFTSVLCSVDFLEILIPLMAHSRWHANAENRWDELFFGADGASGPVPAWLIVNDMEALRGFYEGHASIYRRQVLQAWAWPLFWWSTFIVALVGAMISLMMLFRRQWTEQERLSFPVIQIPLEIATRLPHLFSQKLFWIGFAIAGGANLLNGIHVLYPAVPGIPLLRIFDFRHYLVGPPWDMLGPTMVNIHLFAIGMCFFLPTDLIFSCWFFFLFYRAEQVLARMSGATTPGFPFTLQQSAGAYFGLCVLALWVSRRHVAALARTLAGRPGGLDDGREPLPYRATALILLLCTVYMIGFGAAAGASIGIMIAFFLLFFAYTIAIARMRAELGPPAHDLHFYGPEQIITHAVGSHGAGAGNLSVFTLFFFFNRAYRSHAAPHAIEAFKLAERLGVSARRLLGSIVGAVVIGIVISYWAMLHSVYAHGAGGTTSAYFGNEAWTMLAGWLQAPQGPNIPALVALGVGFVFSLALATLRLTFSWWPFHPVGYAVSATWSMDQLWFSMMLAWTIKVTLLRYGGARVYRPAIPFFIGLVLGEFIIGSLWTIYGAVRGVPVYRFWG